MILDKLNEFADSTALNTGAAGGYLIGNQIDLGLNGRDVGNGEPLYLVIQVDTAITAGASGTVAFSLASDATAVINPAASTKHLTTPVFTVGAGIAAGTVLYAGAIPSEGNAYAKFLGIVQTTGVAAVTAGAVSAFLVRDVAKWKAYDAPFQL